MEQLQFNFTTSSRINVERLSGQNKRLYQHLVAGNTIHCFDPAKYALQIGYLNSRIADLVKLNVPINKRYITVQDVEGNNVTVVEYSLQK